MPNGLRFFTETHPLLQKARGPFRHAFIITREDGQRVFGYALLFPEEVTHPAVKAALRERQKALGLSLDSECRFFTMKVSSLIFLSGFLIYKAHAKNCFLSLSNVGSGNPLSLGICEWIFRLVGGYLVQRVQGADG